MRLALTLIARDEADILDAHLAFHLNAGVDVVLATDHRSSDGTTEILERYAHDGLVHLTREDDVEYREVEWRTRMARLAATEHGADWVINSDADEFWWPRGADLKEVLDSLPARYGIVRGFWRPFLPTADDTGFFAERMTVRLAPDAAIHDPSSQFRPNAKVLHRADPRITVGRGNHSVEDVSLQPLRGWYPVEVLHFPFRSLEQIERKASIYRASPETRLHDAHRRIHGALQEGNLTDEFRTLVVDPAALERGLADGTLVSDTRLRDALRTLAGGEPVPASPRPGTFALPSGGRTGLQLPRPTVVEDAAYAVEAAVLGEADTVRVQRRIDELEKRLSRLEGGGWAQIVRGAKGAASRIRRSRRT
jgi:hypothetical protein